MVKANRENNPNAGILISALRNLGYDNVSAMNDIVDNSLDAEADRIVIDIKYENNNTEIRIVDNGYGMDETVLDQALRLGSDVERNIESELGKFGMGLTTASISMARRVEVITKEKGSKTVLKTIMDIDEIIYENEFVKFFGEANDEDIQLFNQYLDDSDCGTIIRLLNCDKITNRQGLSAQLIREISRTFRDYITSGRDFYVNGTKVEPTDIFMLNDGGEIYSDETYDITLKDLMGKEQKETIRVRLGILPDFGLQGNSDRKINSANQGFYIMRNNREIASGATLGLFTRHPQYNRFRGEIYFSANIDEHMGVNFTKKRVNLHQSIFDKINTDLKHQLRAISNLINKSRTAKESKEIDHNESKRVINKKAPLLHLPKTQEEEKKKKEEPKERKERKKETEPRKKRQEERVRFAAEHGGQGGWIYSCRMEGKTAVIAWNIDHPFYERFVVGTKEDKTLSTSIDFLVYSLATAELGLNEDQQIEMIENFKTTMSMNLRTLLK